MPRKDFQHYQRNPLPMTNKRHFNSLEDNELEEGHDWMAYASLTVFAMFIAWLIVRTIW